MSLESLSWTGRARALVQQRLAPLLSRWPMRDRSVRSALFAFTLSRVIVFFIFIFVLHVNTNETLVLFGAGQEASVSLKQSSIGRRLRVLAIRADGGWNLSTARFGYERMPFEKATAQQNWAIFPLYPLLVRFASKITGGYELTAIALSNLFFLLSLILLHKTVLSIGYEAGVADRTVFYLAVFPTSYFFSVAQTESLFLLLSVGSFYAAARGRWWTAGVIGAFASATRFNGILMLPMLLLLYWQRHRDRLRPNLIGVFLIPIGLLCFMYFLWQITGNAFAFKDIQVRWGRSSGWFFYPILSHLPNIKDLAWPWDFRLLNFSAAMLAFICAFILARRREWALSFYTLASVIVPLSSQSWMGMTRYMMVVFPIFIVLAVAGESARTDQLIRTTFIALMSLMTVFFVAHFTFAMT